MENTLTLTDDEVQALSFFIDMKFPEFLADDLAKDMAFMVAISKVFSWCQEVMAEHGIGALPYYTYRDTPPDVMARMIREMLNDCRAKEGDAHAPQA